MTNNGNNAHNIKIRFESTEGQHLSTYGGCQADDIMHVIETFLNVNPAFEIDSISADDQNICTVKMKRRWITVSQLIDRLSGMDMGLKVCLEDGKPVLSAFGKTNNQGERNCILS